MKLLDDEPKVVGCVVGPTNPFPTTFGSGGGNGQPGSA
jgi:hypothetical protein